MTATRDRCVFAALLTAAMAITSVSSRPASATSLEAPKQQEVHVPAPRLIPDSDWPQQKEKLRELGLKYATAWDLYQALRQQANGGRSLDPANLPDWSGWYTIGDSRLADPDQEKQGKNALATSMPTAKLKPEYEAKLRERMRLIREENIAFDPRLPFCLPPGYPRNMAEPWGREFVVTRDQTWLIIEIGNEIRRVYTDGRGHLPEADREPTYDGDTIGFWDGDVLVTHTNQLKAGLFQLTQPDHSDKIESVEIWRKVAPDLIMVYVWFYDPVVLQEPWFMRRKYVKDPNLDKALRIQYYDCKGNEINDVKETGREPASFVK